MQDSVLALGLAMLNLLSLLPYRAQMHPLWLALFLVSAQCVPLAWRRRWPVPALLCSGLIRNMYDVLQFGYAPLPLAPAICFATVAERSRPWIRWPTLICTAVGIAYAMRLPGHSLPYDAVVQAFIFGTAWVSARSAGPGGRLSPRRHAGRSGPRRNWTRPPPGPRRPPPPSGSGSPANCTTWSRTTSA